MFTSALRSEADMAVHAGTRGGQSRAIPANCSVSFRQACVTAANPPC